MNQIKRIADRSLGDWRGYLAPSKADAGSSVPASGSSAKAAAASQLPVVHRLTIIYLMLPVVIWLVGWFEWWFGVPAAVLLVLGLWPALRPSRTTLNWQALSGTLRQAARPTTIALLLMAFAWVMVTAAGGVFDIENFDWYTYRSILLDLGRGDWPTELLPDLRAYLGEPILLRHYLGYFMVPGLFGNWLGAAALNWAVTLWTWCGVALAMVMFVRGLRAWRVFVAAAVLIFFGGLDFVRTLLFEGWDWIQFGLEFQGWPRVELGSYHIEWAGNPWGVIVQYPSHTAGLLWSPKHFLAAVLFSLLVMQLRQNRRFLGTCGIVLAGATFWSPFVAIGLLPFVAALLYQNGLRPFLRWQNTLLSLPLAGLLAVYLSSGTSEIRRSWIWHIHEGGWLTAAKLLLTVYVFDFALVVFLLLLLRPSLRRDSFFIACLAALVLLPLYSYGDNNDWVMRGVMPALCLLSYYAARAVVGFSRERAHSGDYAYLGTFGLLATALVVGALTPLFDLTRANNHRDFGLIRHEQLGAEYSVVRSLESAHPRYHATNELPVWFLNLLRLNVIQGAEDGDSLVAQSKYDVHLVDHNLIYTRKPCIEDEEGSRFFLHIIPYVDSSFLNGRAHDNLDFYFTRKHGFKIGQTCFAVRELPGTYEAAHIKTGQLKADQSGHSWLVNYFSKPFRERLVAEAGEPVARTQFDIYLHREKTQGDGIGAERRRLLYAKSGCSQQDAESRFILRVVPKKIADLPEGRQHLGFDLLDFDFQEFGGRSNGDCFVVRDLPEYEIVEIETGELRPDGSTVWKSRIGLDERDSSSRAGHYTATIRRMQHDD